jgi:CheY-like chemotaxis protein
VLLVDDDADTAEAICAVLVHSGAEVVSVTSAGATLVRLGTFDPHLVISDISMPEMDGCALIETIRTTVTDKRLPAVALTAHVKPRHRQLADDAGFDGYLTKPIAPQELVRALVAVTN